MMEWYIEQIFKQLPFGSPLHGHFHGHPFHLLASPPSLGLIRAVEYSRIKDEIRISSIS